VYCIYAIAEWSCPAGQSIVISLVIISAFAFGREQS
jgi:hypothetical protein